MVRILEDQIRKLPINNEKSGLYLTFFLMNNLLFFV